MSALRDALAKRVTELEQERDQLKAKNALLTEAGLDLASEIKEWVIEDNAELEALLFFWHKASKSPAACLATYNAWLILDEMHYLSTITAPDTAEVGLNIACNTLEVRAENLFQKSKDISK